MLKVEGLDELLRTLERVSVAPDKCVNRALRTAGDHVRRVEVDVVEQLHDKYSENVGKNELKRYAVKSRKGGSKYVDIGLRSKVTKSQRKKDSANIKAGNRRPTHWDKVKGIYYNNYGFYHNRTGEYVAGTHWIGKAYDESAEKAYRIIRDEIVKEMRLK